MRFWTVQPIAIVAEIEASGAVRVDPDHSKYGGVRPWQYDWLAAALARHSPDFSGGWPWWLSCAEPDLGEMATKTLPGGRNQARLELEIPDCRCVTFPLWMWETIFTGTYLAADRDELDGWLVTLGHTSGEKAPPLPEPFRSELEASWERIFDTDWRPRFWYRDCPPPDDGSKLAGLMHEASTAQVGLTEELRASDVVRIAEFRSQ